MPVAPLPRHTHSQNGKALYSLDYGGNCELDFGLNHVVREFAEPVNDNFTARTIFCSFDFNFSTDFMVVSSCCIFKWCFVKRWIFKGGFVLILARGRPRAGACVVLTKPLYSSRSTAAAQLAHAQTARNETVNEPA
ncbi:hypothetical protein Y032_0211g2197 [Ancylostoma ceylanicum]|uniref:Uncharacterized protein n=1 Tax=Ancylostoma ceylanicum TaxID=53326 RepID=A0A016SL70_9BILA|nr:hypothetical protein Y032_0211g2197 [Ancylostoma ceylanicum]